MEDTGRIHKSLTPSAHRIVFGDAARTNNTELFHLTQVDKAHLVMLAECAILQREGACALIGGIDDLRRTDFAPLRDAKAVRGIYLLYETYLIEKLGVAVGGILQTARSRNDLNATILRLQLRAPFSLLLKETLRLQAVLLRRAHIYSALTMPAYTHYQAAVPVTYGHYLAGIATAVGRDVESLLSLSDVINLCPLGAGAVGGTSFPIDTARTASLLGFASSSLNSFDAVASRDVVLRILACAAVMGVTLSRLCGDLLLWTTVEYGFISLPDQLVGSSSMMPQKRNPFLIEQAQGRSSHALGAFVGAASAMHGTPFTNSVAVGTEAVSQMWPALQALTESVTLLRLVVDGARPNAARMLERATEGYTTATELANRLVVEGRRPFRAAHREVGKIVTYAAEHGVALETAAKDLLDEELHNSLQGLDPATVGRTALFGGGPGPAALHACLAGLLATWSAQMRLSRTITAAWAEVETRLTEAQEHLCLESTVPNWQGNLISTSTVARAVNNPVDNKEISL
jgi:argininosuccinate lyase